MNLKVLSLCVAVLFIAVSLVSGQTMQFKSAWSFPTIDQDSLLAGLASIRNVQYHPDPLGDGVAGFIATHYNQGGGVAVFKCVGNDSIELAWYSPEVYHDTLTGNSTPRYAVWGDLDNDGTIEVIFQHNRVGVEIYEWDEVAGSWNFGTQPARVIGEPDIPLTGNGYTEFLPGVDDLDGDGVNEMFLSINSTPSSNDRYYVLSIVGTYSTGDPGFSSVTLEAEFIKTDPPYSLYGGGTPWAAFAADLNGTGNKELVFHNWNYGHVTLANIPSADTYTLVDTAGGEHYIWATYPDDEVAYMGGFVFDANQDGREEVYICYYNITGAWPGTVAMLSYDATQTTTKIDSTNITFMDFYNNNASSSNIFGYGYGDYDQDGNPNIYISGAYGRYVNTAEFIGGQGADVRDTNNWTFQTIYEKDSTIYTAMTITDSAGTVDTSFTIDVSFVSKFAARNSDFDKDGFEDMILSFQALEDSIEITERTWNGASYDTVIYNIVNPKRWSIRMIESDIPNNLRAKDLTVIVPDDYVLKQNYPNPFNPVTNIEFILPIRKKVSLEIYNSLGQKVKTLVDNKTLRDGLHQYSWDATNDAGNRVASGVYIYTLKFGNFHKSMKMTLLK